jgi:uncharacterized tellurite resistance protein B-like protein
MKQLHTNPAFNLDSPLEAMALLLLATAKIDGDLSSDEKNQLRHIFQHSFNQSSRDASSLLSSSSYLLGSGEEVFSRPHDVLARSLDKFSPEQRQSSMELLKQISEVGSAASDAQIRFMESIRTALFNNEKNTQGWQ